MADIFEEALSSIGAAISDIREKVVEEGWFGRAVTDGQNAGTPEATPDATPAAPTPEETPQIACLFDQQLDTIISAPIDPDIAPHGQVHDR